MYMYLINFILKPMQTKNKRLFRPYYLSRVSSVGREVGLSCTCIPDVPHHKGIVIGAIADSQMQLSDAYPPHFTSLLTITAKRSFFGPQMPIIHVLFTIFLRDEVTKNSCDIRPTPHKISFLHHCLTYKRPAWIMSHAVQWQPEWRQTIITVLTISPSGCFSM